MTKRTKIIILLVIVVVIAVPVAAFGPRVARRIVLQFGPNPICDVTSPPVTTQGGTWSQGAPLPWVRGEFDGTALDGLIYQVGGFVDDYQPVNYFDEYDPATNSWKQLAPAPINVNHTGFTSLDGKLYMSGGFTNISFQQATNNTFWVYDPPTNKWSQLANMPASRAMHVMGAINGKLYVASGLTDADSLSVWAYDPKTDTWDTSLAPMPGPERDHAAGAVVDGKLYVIGGRWLTKDNFDFVDVYDPATNTWERKTPMPNPRGGIRGTVLDNQIHIIGGQWVDGFCVYALHEVYDPATDTWTRLADIPRPRHSVVTATVGDKIYFISGSSGPSDKTLYSFTNYVDIYSATGGS